MGWPTESELVSHIRVGIAIVSTHHTIVIIQNHIYPATTTSPSTLLRPISTGAGFFCQWRKRAVRRGQRWVRKRRHAGVKSVGNGQRGRRSPRPIFFVNGRAGEEIVPR